MLELVVPALSLSLYPALILCTQMRMPGRQGVCARVVVGREGGGRGLRSPDNELQTEMWGSGGVCTYMVAGIYSSTRHRWLKESVLASTKNGHCCSCVVGLCKMG